LSSVDIAARPRKTPDVRWIVIWSLSLLLLLPACGRRRALHPRSGGQGQWGAPAGQRGGWISVSPPRTGVTVQMPAAPQTSTRSGRDDDGARFHSTMVRSQAATGSFALIITEWEGGLVGDPLIAAAEVADDLFETQELGRRRSNRLDMPGFYGREDVGVAPNGAFVALRQFVGRHRIYVALAVVANHQLNLQVAEHFMASIELQNSDALLPFGQPSELEAIYMPEADFSVRMPALTHRSSSEVEIAGRTRSAWTYESRGSDARYRIRVIAFEESPPEGILETVGTQLSLGTRQHPTDASGFPGHVYSRASDSGVGAARVFVTATRVYVVDEAHRRGATEHEARAREFFDSFRIH